MLGVAVFGFFALSAIPTSAAGEFTVVAIMYGHANEGTWDPAAYQGLLKAQKEIPFTLKVNEGTSTQDAEKIIRNWAAKDVNVIFAHSNIYTEQLLNVAKRFKDQKFAIVDMAVDRPNVASEPGSGALRTAATWYSSAAPTWTM